jgi:tRNA(Ile)-lysidine synthetase-like protein
LELTKDIFNNKNTIIISLSGGVDSMVCSWLLKKHFPTKTLIAVHVNYNNRSQCDKEVLFLQDWCCKLEIPLFVRKIDEICKNRCVSFEMRDLYETYTRNVRYGTYKYVYGLFENDKIPNVVLGHNRDDTLENILTNIAHKNKYECLQGMTSIGVQDGVMFLRPLLKIPKDTIIQFAQDNNIPYLPNSTPPMCQRGQIRNTVAPCLNAWHSQFIPSLFEMSDTLQSLFNMMETLTKSFIESGRLIEASSFEKCLKLHELQEEAMFWKKVISGLFGLYVSHRSVVNLIDNIKVYKKKFVKTNNNDTRKIHVSNDIYICLCKLRSGDLLLTIKSKR